MKSLRSIPFSWKTNLLITLCLLLVLLTVLSLLDPGEAWISEGLPTVVKRFRNSFAIASRNI